MCCSICKQDNIKGSCEDNFVYCDDCEDETTAIFKENKND